MTSDNDREGTGHLLLKGHNEKNNSEHVNFNEDPDCRGRNFIGLCYH